jgi:hypothetical protein
VSLSDFQDWRARCEELDRERRKLADHCVVVVSQGTFKDVWCTLCGARRVLAKHAALKDFHRLDCLVKKVKGEG